MNSIHIGNDHDFKTVRDLLESAAYTAEEVTRRFGLPSYGHYDQDFDREQVVPWDNSAAGVLQRLFIELHPVEQSIANTHLTADGVAALKNLGLLEDSAHLERSYQARAALYPAGDVWIASDAWQLPDRTPFVPPPDVVYSAIVANAYRFLRFLPRRPADNVLDLCSGTGVAALSGAKHFARHAYSCDIAASCTTYAEFNKRLNGLDNVTVGLGDLYEPAGDQTFDRIYVHPPYVPVLRPKYIYHDGGEDGERIVRRVMEGLPRYLRPGGLAYMLTMLTDRANGTIEERLRFMLGSSEAEFDISFFPVWSRTPEQYAVQAAARAPKPLEDAKDYKAVFSRLEIKHLVYGYVYIQRHSEPRASFTIRRQMADDTMPADIRRVLNIETLRTYQAGLEEILGSRVGVNSTTELRVSHSLTPEGWEPSSHMLITNEPFQMEARVDLWAAFLLTVCDSKKTVRQVFTELQDQEVLPRGADPLEFAQAVGVLISGGFLFLEAA